MEFVTLINQTSFTFSYIDPTTVLVSGADCEYILYKRKFWHCADEIPEVLLKAMAQALDQFDSNRSVA